MDVHVAVKCLLDYGFDRAVTITLKAGNSFSGYIAEIDAGAKTVALTSTYYDGHCSLGANSSFADNVTIDVEEIAAISEWSKSRK